MGSSATIMAGIPAKNSALYHAIRFSVGDPTALICMDDQSTLILRDIEMDRALKTARVDAVACPADFEPESGLSGDRETATAQSAAEFLRRKGVDHVVADRTLPLIFAEMITKSGITVECDMGMGVAERRAKDEQEIEWLRYAQSVTENAVRLACELIANATASKQGTLTLDGVELTSEYVRSEIDVFLLRQGFANVPSIVAGAQQGADCHDIGSGPLKTGTPVIIDIFPKDRQTFYNGDCTRTVVHGEVPEPLKKMHAAIIDAKQAGESATQSGVTGEIVHQSVIDRIRAHGYQIGMPTDDAPDEYCAMVHGTGHGIGLDVHESPLLDFKGPELVVGDVLTIEPGLYSKSIGGIRVEDMVVVTADGCENLNKLPEGLTWR